MDTAQPDTEWCVDASGWLNSAIKIPSPNHDQRPQGEVINLVVIHGISLPEGQFGTPWIDALFTNQIKGDEAPGFEPLRELRVSTHLLIRRDGQLVQYVSLNDRAWHAGRSSFEGRERCNDFSIGIELEGADQTPYEAVQYQQLNRLLAQLMVWYPQVTRRRVVGHSDIAPGRKTDPGPAFDWSRVLETDLES